MLYFIQEVIFLDNNIIKIDSILAALEYTPSQMQWSRTKSSAAHIIGYQFSGSFLHTFPTQNLLFSEDTAFFIHKDDTYDVRSTLLGTSIAIHFTCLNDISTSSFALDCKNHPELKRMFTNLLKKWLTKNEICFYDCMSTMYGVIGSMSQMRSEEYIQSSGTENISAAYEYIKLHFSDKNLSIQAAANVAELSVRRFGELFRKKYKITPNRFIVQLRINAAINMLKTGSYSVAAIADAAGFSDVCYFSKVFKNVTGVSPTHF